MSTIIVSNIDDGTKSVASTVVTEGGIKAKFFFNQITPTTTDDYNISSISDDAAAQWTVNFTNSWSAADHTILQGCSFDYLVNARIHWEMDSAPTTSAWDIVSEGAGGGASDYRMLCGAGLGDLA